MHPLVRAAGALAAAAAAGTVLIAGICLIGGSSWSAVAVPWGLALLIWFIILAVFIADPD